MKALREIDELTAQALTSLDNLQPAEANPYLHSKIINRMAHNRQNSAAQYGRLMLRLSAVLLLFLCINITCFYLFKQKHTPAQSTVKGAAAVGQEYFNNNTYNY